MNRKKNEFKDKKPDSLSNLSTKPPITDPNRITVMLKRKPLIALINNVSLLISMK
jgi:hypothetical protein